jgi:hypothetical protein
MAAPRRTYVVSVYDDGAPVLVRDVASDELARLEDLDDLPACIRQWDQEPREEPAR